jgi:hypothetical protein
MASCLIKQVAFFISTEGEHISVGDACTEVEVGNTILNNTVYEKSHYFHSKLNVVSKQRVEQCI